MGRFKSIIRWPLNQVGFDLVRRDRSTTAAGSATWTGRMAHARSLGFNPKTILDGGAFRGLWARDAAQLFRGAQLILVEPNPSLQPILTEVAASISPTPKLVAAALGDQQGTAILNVWRAADNDAGASLLPHVQGTARGNVAVRVDTIDNIAASVGVQPDLVKLDLQGGELAALRGASGVLADAEMLIVEFGCIDAYIDRATPRDVMEIAYANGFVLYDIFDQHYRPHDGALGGGDFCFVKRDSGLRVHRGWE